MTDIGIARSGTRRRSSGNAPSTALHRLNNRLAVFVLAVVALSPLPLASNRPFFWALSAAIIGLIGIFYLATIAIWRQPFRVPLRRVALIAVPFLALCLFLIAELLPIGKWRPLGFVDTTGAALNADTLSLTPGNTWLMLLQMLGYGMLFLLVLQVGANARRALLVLRLIFFMVAAYAAFALVELRQLGDTILGMPKWTYLGSATGPFVNRNSFATFLAFGLVVGVALMADEFAQAARNRLPVSQLVVQAISLLLICTALLLTGSRMGTVAGAAGCFWVLAVAASKARIGPGGWLVRVGLLGVVVVALYVVFGTAVLERVGKLGEDADLRSALYQQVLGMIATRPWLGFGGGSFEYAYPLFQHPPVASDLVWDKAHSTYLALWSELGLAAGSILPLIIAIIGVTTTIRLFKSERDLAIYAAVGGVIVTAAVHSLVDFSLEVQAVAYLFIAILALGMAREVQKPARPDRGSQPAEAQTR